MRIRTAMGATAAAAALLPATAAGDPRGTLELRFTTDRPGTPSGLHVRVTYPPPPGASKPSPIEEVQIHAPAGTRIDPSAVPMCTAGDGELRLRGLSACPRESRLGRGKVVANTGLFPSSTFDAVVVAAPGELLEIVLVPGTEMVIATDRLRIDGSTLTGDPPSTPGGPPDFRTSVEEVSFLIAAPPVGGAAVVTTPPTCTEGRWTSSARFGFADGVVATPQDASPCVAPAKKASKKSRKAKQRKRGARRPRQ